MFACNTLYGKYYLLGSSITMSISGADGNGDARRYENKYVFKLNYFFLFYAAFCIWQEPRNYVLGNTVPH